MIGPITFIVYINDLRAVHKNCYPLMEGDNTVVYCANNDNKVVYTTLQSNLCKVQKCCYKTD